MKKIIICIIAITAFLSCSKENSNHDGYSAEEKEVIDVLRGEWKRDGGTEILSFTPFGETKEMSGNLLGSTFVGYFHGRSTREFDYLGKEREKWDMYFYVNVSKKEIAMYGVVDENKYSLAQTKKYDYSIIDKNTIRLHDQSLSMILTYKYTRTK